MLEDFLIAAYVAASVGLLLYGANCYVLLVLFLRRRRVASQRSAAVIAAAAPRFSDPDGLPVVTTQIPLYNEANVAERAMRAAAAVDYPLNRHQVQVLDDSTDETREIVDRVARELVSRGHWVAVVRRTARGGFKAGALAHGLETAAGEFVAIFDADFRPPPDFLRKTLPFFFLDDGLALVQARWTHLNRADSLLTRAQAIGIDGHFMIEQSARTFNGLLMNFNGTAGLWRRAAVEDAGGWRADTLTEDLDLSYRVQLRGWRTHYLAELAVPGELPSSYAAFKSQQFRWAKGSIQTAIKLLPMIFRSRRSLWVKIQAFLHLTHYAVHPLMLAVALLAVPATLSFSKPLPSALVAFVALTMGLTILAPNLLYIAGQRSLYPRWGRRVRWLPILTVVGIGVALSNSWAVIEALIGRPSDFIRTPKRGDKTRKLYKAANQVQPWVEVALGVYCAVSLFLYLAAGNWLLAAFLALYAVGFLGFGASGLLEAFASRTQIEEAAA